MTTRNGYTLNCINEYQEKLRASELVAIDLLQYEMLCNAEHEFHQDSYLAATAHIESVTYNKKKFALFLFKRFWLSLVEGLKDFDSTKSDAYRVTHRDIELLEFVNKFLQVYDTVKSLEESMNIQEHEYNNLFATMYNKFHEIIEADCV